ncbi:MAG: 6-phosphofructokinase [Pirellulales bacterium]|nr:6-phosphofructokinase [Pirellulales bacterium]
MPTPLSSPPRPKTDLRRVAILFSGGPAPAANAVIASAASCFSKVGIEVLGIRNGYSQLMEYKPPSRLEEGVAYAILDHRDLEGARTSSGIMIGTARANPGKLCKEPKDLDDPKKTAPLQTTYDALRSLEVDALISIGGDDTLTTAAKFKLFQDRMPADKKRIRVVHLPKTIDNDYQGIDFTFGYFSAVEMLATQCRNLLADAVAARAYFIAQVMGRKAGWLAYGAAIAGEANLVIGLEDIPKEWWYQEITVSPKTGKQVIDEKTGKPQQRDVFKVDAVVSRIVDMMEVRHREGKPYGVIVMAEGLGEYLPLDVIHTCVSEEEYRSLEPDEFGHFPVSQLKFSSRFGRLASEEFQRRTGKKAKVNGVQFGYEVRCHRPTAFDVALGSQLGVGAYRALAEEGKNGVMVSVSGQLALLYAPFEKLINYDILRANDRPISPGEDFHLLARYLEPRVEEKG